MIKKINDIDRSITTVPVELIEKAFAPCKCSLINDFQEERIVLSLFGV